MVKSTYCSYTGPEFTSQHAYDALQLQSQGIQHLWALQNSACICFTYIYVLRHTNIHAKLNRYLFKVLHMIKCPQSLEASQKLRNTFLCKQVSHLLWGRLGSEKRLRQIQYRSSNRFLKEQTGCWGSLLYCLDSVKFKVHLVKML